MAPGALFFLSTARINGLQTNLLKGAYVLPLEYLKVFLLKMTLNTFSNTVFLFFLFIYLQRRRPLKLGTQQKGILVFEPVFSPLQPCVPQITQTGSRLKMTTHQSHHLRSPYSHQALSKHQYHVPMV